MDSAKRMSPEDVRRALKQVRAQRAPAFSICTLVTRPAEYHELRKNLVDHGFTEEDVEYIWLDNHESNNSFDAFQAYNAFLQEARSPYIVLCHQDILLLHDGREQLEDILHMLQTQHPDWGLCGNAGVRTDGVLALRITDPHGENRSLGGPFPSLVNTLDENFIVVRRAANLALSHDLKGYHMYGTDLCLIAGVLGWSAYVIDFHLFHKSGGRTDESYYEGLRQMERKYKRAFRTRWIKLPTLRPAFISGAGRIRHAVAHRVRRLCC